MLISSKNTLCQGCFQTFGGQCICLEIFWTVFSGVWSVHISLLIQTKQLFHWRKQYYGYNLYLWFEVKNTLMMDLFLINMQLFISQDINWWTGVVWIIVIFLSAVWTLILTAPIHCRWSIGEQEMLNFYKSVLMKKQTHLHLGWREGE